MVMGPLVLPVLGALPPPHAWSAIVKKIAQVLSAAKMKNLVIDPALMSKAGFPLLRNEAHDTISERLFPLARLVTPNLPEAEARHGRAAPDL